MLLFTSSGTGLSASVTNVASITTIISIKLEMLVDTIKTGSGFSGPTCFAIDSDGAGTTKKIAGYFTCDNSGNVTMTTTTPNGATTSASVAQSTLPATGSIVHAYFEYNNSVGQIVANLVDAGGSALISQTRSSFFGGALPTSNGRVTINATPGLQSGSKAVQYGGMAVYNVALTGANQYSAPGTGDSGIVAMWKCNDAFQGTSPSTAAASVGSQGLVLTASQYSWTGNGKWFPPPAVAPPTQPNTRATFAARHRSFYY